MKSKSSKRMKSDFSISKARDRSHAIVTGQSGEIVNFDGVAFYKVRNKFVFITASLSS